ncbi:glycosyltransferase [bacterium]|nr:glycosyltransferase [bacterium]
MKLAIVHEWLTGFGGAERCVMEFADMFPDAPIFTSVYDKQRFGDIFPPERVRTSFLQSWHNSKEKYRNYLPFMPKAFRSFDLSGFDVILSSNHCCAKGIRRPDGAIHISYIYTPMRYIWELHGVYRASLSGVKRILFDMMIGPLRKFDLESNSQVDYFIPISHEVDRRLKRTYNRKGDVVIYPPVDVDKFAYDGAKRDYYLIAHRFVPYKRVDLAIDAFNQNGLPLKVLGIGPDEDKLKSIAKPNIEFLGFVPEDDLPRVYGQAKALVFTSFEDFGLTPIEAMSAGTPVIAYGAGGALETVVENKTGTFFSEQTPESLNDAVNRFDSMLFDKAGLIEHARKFDVSVFRKQIKEFVDKCWQEKNSNIHGSGEI